MGQVACRNENLCTSLWQNCWSDTFQLRRFRKACYPGGSLVCCSSWVTPRVPVALFTTSRCPLQSCRRAELSRAWSAANVVFSLAASLFTEEIPPHNEEMLEINQPRGRWRANCWTVCVFWFCSGFFGRGSQHKKASDSSFFGGLSPIDNLSL